MASATRAETIGCALTMSLNCGGRLLGLSARLVIQALGLGLGVAGEVADAFLHTATQFTGSAFYAIVHCCLL